MVNTAFFRKMNPNYPQPRVIKLAKQDPSLNISTFFGFEDNSISKANKITSGGKEPTQLEEHELIICCLTVPGFSLGDKLWRNAFPPS